MIIGEPLDETHNEGVGVDVEVRLDVRVFVSGYNDVAHQKPPTIHTLLVHKAFNQGGEEFSMLRFGIFLEHRMCVR